MHGTRHNLDEVTLLYRHPADQFFVSVFMNHPGKFFSGLCMVTDDKACILRAVHDIPAFGLAVRAAFVLSGIGIVRVDLDA